MSKKHRGNVITITKISSTAILITVTYQFILIYSSIVSAVNKDWKNMKMSIATIFCLFIPFLLKKIAEKKDLLLPPGFLTVLPSFLFAALYLGEIKKLYYKLSWWDLLLHGISGAYFAIIPFYLIKGVIRKEDKITRQRYAKLNALFAFSFSIAIGTIWEMIEFLSDHFFHTKLVKGGLKDTASDLIVKIISAFISTSAFYLKETGMNR